VQLVRVNKQHPCPICGRDHYCSVTADGGAVFCTKEPSDKPGKDGWWHRLGPGTPAASNGHGPTRRYAIHDAEGVLVAYHCRVDLPGGKKRMWWELPDGTKGLGGRKPETLPLYGIEAIAAAGPPGIVIVCEGEKARDALKSRLVPAVGTVTGADTIPSVASLEPLIGFDVCLWPDNDDKGRAHTAAIARRLLGLGVKPRVFTWPEAPEKGDAADFVAAGLGKEELNRLYAEAVVVEEAEKEPPPAVAAPPMTDLGNAQRLVARRGEDVRWCDAMGRWFHWNGVLWEQVGPTILQDLAKETALALYDEAAATTDPEQRAALMKWAKASGSGRAIASMVALTKTVTGSIAVDADRLDADPMLLGVENGVVDLRTGEGHEPRRADLITKSCRAPFDPDAVCPLWEGFLGTIFAGDAEVIGYVQRAVGYSLTGRIGERVVFIEHGTGTNGKTTFLEVIAHVLGTYAMSTPVETLIARKDRGIPNDLARLKSARFVSATESERGAKLAEAFIKAVTGGDRVTARFLHQEFFDFVPQLKLWLATNHRPEIASGGKAIWKRIRLIPFEVDVEAALGDRLDTNFKEKLLGEAAGILAWAVRGCVAWQEVGLKEPESIRRANTDYEEDEDILGWFLEERAIVEPNVWVAASELYAAFKDWAESHGEDRLSAKAFSQALVERKGIKRQRQGGTGNKGFRGVRLPEPVTKKPRERQEDGLGE
jgi:putative DNA primase/helicase